MSDFLLKRHDIKKSNLKRNIKNPSKMVEYKTILENGYRIKSNEHQNLLTIENRYLNVTFNLRRGLTIERLGFSKHNFEHNVGKYNMGISIIFLWVQTIIRVA